MSSTIHTGIRGPATCKLPVSSSSSSTASLVNIISCYSIPQGNKRLGFLSNSAQSHLDPPALNYAILSPTIAYDLKWHQGSQSLRHSSDFKVFAAHQVVNKLPFATPYRKLSEMSSSDLDYPENSITQHSTDELWTTSESSPVNKHHYWEYGKRLSV